jgi:hypothetical protein
MGVVRALAPDVDDVAVAVTDQALAPAVSAADGDGPSTGAGDDGVRDALEQRTALTARALLAVRAVGLVMQRHSVSAAPVSRSGAAVVRAGACVLSSCVLSRVDSAVERSVLDSAVRVVCVPPSCSSCCSCVDSALR